MMGLGRTRSDDDPLARAMKLFDDAGYVGVVATNCDQTYHRYLKPGELVAMSAEITDVVGPKQTALGEGYFINQKIRWHVGDEEVAEMDWRIMKFLPAANQAAQAAAETGALPEDLDPDKLMRPSSSRTPSSSGTVSTPTNCESSAAPTARCSIRRCPLSGPTRTHLPITWSPRARAPCSAMSCTMPQGARTHAAVRDRARRTRRGRPDAR